MVVLAVARITSGRCLARELLSMNPKTIAVTFHVPKEVFPMKLSRLTRFALVAALAIPAAAQAQVEALKFEGVKFPSAARVGSYMTGPYMASRAPFSTPATTFDIYCIDLDHFAKSAWTAHYVTFAEAVGAYNVEATRQLGAFTLADLRTAAYLASQFSFTPLNQWNNIHGQIWSLFSTKGAVSGYAAAAAVSKGIAGGDASWDSYGLILDENAFSPNYDPRTADLNQAFITDLGNTTIKTVVPEPSTYVLMGAGLLAVGFASRRRRRSI